MQDTQPMPPIPLQKPTLAQLRQQCGMSQMQVAQASGVRLCRVAWIEIGIESSLIDILMVVHVYSRKLGQRYSIEDIYGVKVQEGKGNGALEAQAGHRSKKAEHATGSTAFGCVL